MTKFVSRCIFLQTFFMRTLLKSYGIDKRYYVIMWKRQKISPSLMFLYHIQAAPFSVRSTPDFRSNNGMRQNEVT